MPDPTVTDDDRREARNWAQNVVHAPGGKGVHSAARYILDTIPALPKSLADELREVAIQCGYDSELLTLADRVEAVEKEVTEADRDRDEALSWVDNLTRQRDEARAEVERLRKELGEERGKVHESSQLEDEAVSLSYWLADNLSEHVDDQDNETLTATVRRFVKQEAGKITSGRTTPGVDPADVPGGEAWLVQVDGEEPAAGIKTEGGLWRVYCPPGGTCIAGSHAITLISRLVREAPRVITTANDLSTLPEDTIVRDNADYAWQRVPARGWMGPGSLSPCSPHRLLERLGPLTVLYVPEVVGG